jgi:hypothetical protein
MDFIFLFIIFVLVHSGFKAKGINSRPDTCIPQFLEKCQELSNVHYEEMHIPTGEWAGQLGAMVCNKCDKIKSKFNFFFCKFKFFTF